MITLGPTGVTQTQAHSRSKILEAKQNLGPIADIVFNAIYSRSQLLKDQLDTRRDIDDECGYPKDPIKVELYQELFDRDPIARRACEMLAKESWQVQPSVYETEDPEVITDFEKRWDEVCRGLRNQGAGDSYYQDEEGNPIWEYLLRADVQCGIGQYGVILLGLDDGADLSEPAEEGSAENLTFLRVFPESLAVVAEFDSDESSARYMQPVLYTITFNDPRSQTGGIGLTSATKTVHWTRLIHVADNLSSSEVFGDQRMRVILNRILDLRKIYGADGEAFWRSAILKLFFETLPQLGSDPEIDKSALRDEIEAMMNGLQQWMGLTGMTVKSVPPSVVDPQSHINAQIEAICIALGCPVRIFKGSERGELASSQDDQAWNDRLRQREHGFITPRIIVPLIDRLIWLGVLPKPAYKKKLATNQKLVKRNGRQVILNAKGKVVGEQSRAGYSVYWPDLTSQTDAEKANVALVKTQAMAAYIAGGVEALVPPMVWMTHTAGWTDSEAMSALEAAEELAEEKAEEQALLQEEKKLEQIEQGGQVPPAEDEQGDEEGNLEAEEDAVAVSNSNGDGWKPFNGSS